ncbi:MAG TPA: serine hydrolase domain-containing protein [Baekduia sp.]|nr:serine hydrolase domain-containing protein [Baekduia sp.]
MTALLTGRPGRRGLAAGLTGLAVHPAGVVSAMALILAVLPGTASGKDCGSRAFDRGGTCTTFRAAVQQVDEIARTVLVAEGGKAALVRVQIGKRTLLSRGYGESMEGVPASPRMHFRPGSMVLPLMTTLLLQLQDARQLSLDDTVARWFRRYPNADRVTLRMLASSTSGYWDYAQQNEPFQKVFQADVFRHWSDDELLRYAFAQPLACEPGACFHYAHTNFVVLGRILEKVTGQSVTSLMQRRFLGPLRLRNTRISKRPAIPAPALHAYSTDRGAYEDSTSWSPSWSVGVGMVMTSTVSDMIKVIRAIGSGRLFSRSARRQMAAALSRGLPGAPPPTLDYGLGIDVANGWLFQNPQANGYIGLLAYLPPRDIAIVVENTNGPGVPEGRAIAGVIAKKITQYLAPDRPL